MCFVINSNYQLYNYLFVIDYQNYALLFKIEMDKIKMRLFIYKGMMKIWKILNLAT